jgi:hypothetical protein
MIPINGLEIANSKARLTFQKTQEKLKESSFKRVSLRNGVT